MGRADENFEEWNILVGEIVAPFGIRGEVRVIPTTENEHRFDAGSRLLLRHVNSSGRRFVEVESSRRTHKSLLVKLRGVANRTEAESLRGALLFVTEAMLPPLPAGRFYVKDVVGMEVCSPAGEVLGTVEDVLETGGNDVFVTRCGLIPATKEIVRSIDLASRRMIIELIPGLLDEKLSDDDAF